MNSMKKIWTNEEIELVKKLYELEGLDTVKIAALMNRSKNSILVKIKRLKLKHTAEQTFKIKHNNMSGLSNPMYGKKAWCNGETKETNVIIKNKAIKQSITRKKLFAQGKLSLSGKHNPMYGTPSWSRGLSTESSDILKKSGEKISIFRKKEWENMTEEKKNERRKHCAIIGARCKKNKTTIELKVEEILKTASINYLDNYYKDGFVFDFYLPYLNAVIECQGDYWHANPAKYSFLNINNIQKTNLERDKRKKRYLTDNNMPALFLWEYDIKKKFNIIQKQIKSFCQ